MPRESSIEVTGRVEDVRPYLGRAEVVIVPLRIGSGTRIKIFEAMAMAKPVVSTTIGAEGLPVTSGENVVLADTPEAFAELIQSESARMGPLLRRAVRAEQGG